MKASVEHCMDEGLPFALYRLPGREPSILVQTTGRPHSFLLGEPFPLDKGYLLVPFSPVPNEPAYMLAPDIQLREDRPELLPNGQGEGRSLDPEAKEEDDKADYMAKVERLVEGIRSDEELEKVVLSRSEWVGREGKVGDFFERMRELYPDAFVHIFHLPDQATWMGATPELLLDLRGDEGRTQALAGTRPKREREWAKKEELEQASVEHHIKTVLEKNGIPLRSRKGPETVRAGSIEHLSTQFSFSKEAVQKVISPFLRDLHPTPAVSGLPRNKALDWIRELEERPRGFYAGAIGPWGIEGESELYVNLRCARIWRNELELFVGGGINSGSDPEEEWDETVWKAGTMKRILY